MTDEPRDLVPVDVPRWNSDATEWVGYDSPTERLTETLSAKVTGEFHAFVRRIINSEKFGYRGDPAVFVREACEKLAYLRGAQLDDPSFSPTVLARLWELRYTAMVEAIGADIKEAVENMEREFSYYLEAGSTERIFQRLMALRDKVNALPDPFWRSMYGKHLASSEVLREARSLLKTSAEYHGSSEVEELDLWFQQYKEG